MLIFSKSQAPIPMLLWCPGCGARHVDQGEFATRSHHSHACQTCGMVWRPALVPTVGVQFLPGFKDEFYGVVTEGARLETVGAKPEGLARQERVAGSRDSLSCVDIASQFGSTLFGETRAKVPPLADLAQNPEPQPDREQLPSPTVVVDDTVVLFGVKYRRNDEVYVEKFSVHHLARSISGHRPYMADLTPPELASICGVARRLRDIADPEREGWSRTVSFSDGTIAHVAFLDGDPVTTSSSYYGGAWEWHGIRNDGHGVRGGPYATNEEALAAFRLWCEESTPTRTDFQVPWWRRGFGPRALRGPFMGAGKAGEGAASDPVCEEFDCDAEYVIVSVSSWRPEKGIVTRDVARQGPHWIDVSGERCACGRLVDGSHRRQIQ